jgi:cytoskeleton protein RodZ
MNESETVESTDAAATAGAMLRAARNAQGMHIAALAATIKVQQRKLESLEADRYDELPDPAFARALAQTMCRVLKIDPVPVLAKLPQPRMPSLETPVGMGGGQAFDSPRMGFSSVSEIDIPALLGHPAFWGPVLILAGALLLWKLPAGVLQWDRKPAAATAAAPEPAPVQAPLAGTTPAAPGPGATPSLATAPMPQADAAAGPAAGSVVLPGQAPPAAATLPVVAAAVAPVAAPAVVPAVVPAVAPAVAPTLAPVVAPAPAAQNVLDKAPPRAGAAAAVSSATGGTIMLRAQSESWVEVIDAQGQVLIHRSLGVGENVGLNGQPPFRVRVGNVAATEVFYRGRPVDLKAHDARGKNIARFELN